jgi:hypothetical protein
MTATATPARPLRLVFSEDKSFGPSLRLPLTRLKEVQSLMDAHGIMNWAAGGATSFDGGPYMTTIAFSRNSDPLAIQELIDSIPWRETP